jgi:hypothetical protein
VHTPPTLNDQFKRIVAAVSNLVFLFAVVGLWLLEPLLFQRHQLSGDALLVFIVGSLSLVVYYSLHDRLHVAREAVTASMGLLPEAARTGVADAPSDGERRDARDWRTRVTSTLWTPVIFNFWLVGWLIYASGGITNSPHSGVPVAMVLVGQSVYDVPQPTFTAGSRLPRLPRFCLAVARLYWLSLLVVVTLLGCLVVAQVAHPLTTRTAPTAEVMAVMLISLFASMCVTLVTRRADQRQN